MPKVKPFMTKKQQKQWEELKKQWEELKTTLQNQAAKAFGVEPEDVQVEIKTRKKRK